MAKQQQTVDDLIAYIIKQKLKPGDKLPNEQELSNLVGAGRSTIREAMRTLATRNIVEIRQGSGTYISNKMGMIEDPFGLFFMEDNHKLMKDLMDLRIRLEPEIASLAALHATEEDLLLIESSLLKIEECMRNKVDYTEEDIAFHQAIANSSDNLIMPRLIPLLGTISRYMKASSEALKEETLQSHQAIYDAIASHSPTAAKDAMYLHLVHSRVELNKQTSIS